MTMITAQPSAILRVAKLCSWSAMAASAGHTWRTLPVPHAVPERRHLNEDWRSVTHPADLRAAVEMRLATVTQPPARGAVLALEYLVTARRAAFTAHGGQTDAAGYFRDAVAFLEERHGAANVVAINIQHDEIAPHLVAYVVPLVERPARTIRRNVFAKGHDAEGRQRRELRTFAAPPAVVLSADHYNGTPVKLAALQSEFAQRVAARHGLARGLEMSAATHTTNRAHHAALARAMADHVGLAPEDLERRGRLWSRESPEEQARRLSEAIREHYAPTVARAATAGHDRRRAREMEETARRHRERYERERQAHEASCAALERLTAGQTPEQRQALERLAAQHREANHRAREAKRQRQAAAQQERRTLEAQREEAARQARRDREEKLAARLRRVTPEQFARAPLAIRREAWQLLFRLPDLKDAADRMAASELLEHGGHLSAKGRALVERAAPQRKERPTDPDADAARGVTPAHAWEVIKRRRGAPEA